jgi:putative urate catabolism protein
MSEISPDPKEARDMQARDLVGYGSAPPHPRWPGAARIAVNFNLNYEAGGEATLANGDDCSEGMLNDIGVASKAGVRVPLAESAFEYGSRVGVWRVLALFRRFDVKVSVLAVVRALEQNPAVVSALLADGHEIVSHGWRWIDYAEVPEQIEREHVARAVSGIARLTGARPFGWMTGRPGPNTRRLLVEEGGFLYDRDSLADELPYWLDVGGRAHLVIPYSYETNDNRFNENTGFATAEQFFVYLRDAFDILYEEGATAPKLLSIGLHDRLIGRPARIGGLARFLEHIRRHDQVWICRGLDIARHWREHFPPPLG